MMIEPKKPSRWWRIAPYVLLTAAVLGVFMYRDTLRTQFTNVLADTDEEPIPVRTLERTSFRLEVPAFGEITGLQSVPVPTPRTNSGGLLVAWLVPEGSWVGAGDPVVRFDNTDALLNLEQQQNTLEANEEQVKVTEGRQETEALVLDLDRTDAELEYEYAMSVLPEDETIFSKWDIIEAQIDAVFAEKRIENLDHKKRVQQRIARSDRQILAIERNRAMTEVSMARQTLGSLELLSPVDGLVVYRRDRRQDPKIGDESWPGQVLVEIVDLAALQARIHVLERDAGGLEEGKEVRIRVDAIPEKEYRGVIASVAALPQPLERDSPLKHLSCEVRILDVGRDLRMIRPGMPLEADVILSSYESCFVVPASAVTSRDSASLVHILRGEEFDPRPVEIGPGSHGLALILDGVEEGEIIALQNPFETRKSYLPDFGKGAVPGDSSPRGMRRFRFR